MHASRDAGFVHAFAQVKVSIRFLSSLFFLLDLFFARFHWSLVLATCGVVCGVCLTTYSTGHEGHVSAASIALGFVSALAGGAEGVLVGLVLKRHAVHPSQVDSLLEQKKRSFVLFCFVNVRCR